MAVPTRNKFRNKPSGSRVAALAILVLIVTAVVGYYLLSPSRKTDVTPRKPELSHVKPGLPAASIPQTAIPEPPAGNPPLRTEQGDYPSTTALPETEKPGSVVSRFARLAIIIDDMGGSMSEARSLAAIGVPLTFSIIPGLRNDTVVAGFAASKCIETMIHIPMQPKGWPAHRLEANGLLVSMDDAELRERVARFVREIPGAVGVNNHMGSEFTEHEDKMRCVLEVLKEKNLFFVDSVTTPRSTGLGLSHELGIKSGRRNVFLDNEQERSYILAQLDQAVKLAKKSGTAIAICHPHQATIAALASALPSLVNQGVTLVPASQLVR